MSIERVADLTDQQCREIAGAAETNHIWINAFSLINPSDDMVMSIGRTVADMLRQKDNLLPARADHGCEGPGVHPFSLTSPSSVWWPKPLAACPAS